MNHIGFLVFGIALGVMLAGSDLPLWSAYAGWVAGMVAYVAAAKTD